MKFFAIKFFYLNCYIFEGLYKEMYICSDDTNWFYDSDYVLGYELDCIYESISSINLMDATALFTYKPSLNNWFISNFERVDCQTEITKWATLRLNFTYTTQKECDRTLQKIAGFRQGAFCRLRKNEFLKELIFKVQRRVLESTPNIFPYPYGFIIRYTCN